MSGPVTGGPWVYRLYPSCINIQTVINPICVKPCLNAVNAVGYHHLVNKRKQQSAHDSTALYGSIASWPFICYLLARLVLVLAVINLAEGHITLMYQIKLARN